LWRNKRSDNRQTRDSKQAHDEQGNFLSSPLC
jgi:hypothetical protein